MIGSALLTLALLTAQPQTAVPAAEAAAVWPAEAYRAETVAAGLDHPWSIAFLPDGDILVTERPGRLRVIRNGRLLEAPVEGMPAVHARGQAGLFEAVPHPDFAENRLVYISYAKGGPEDSTLALARGRFVPRAEGGRLENVEIIYEADGSRSSNSHYGGRMVFLPDGTLLLTSGEAYDRRHDAQNLSNHLGKILRLDAEGGAPGDNPFIGVPGVRPEIFTYGHRNPQGITLARGRIYANEHGPLGGDEINLIQPGANYAWPVASFGRDYSGVQMTPFTSWEGTKDPLVYWSPSIAPSALAFCDDCLFPALSGKFLVSALAAQEVRLVDPADPARQTIMFEELGKRVRDVTIGPDGAIWLALETREGAEGEILRITPAP